jgi:TIR domain
MAESADLAIIRREAFLRALHRAAQNPSVTVVTVTLLAEELSLHIAQLGFVIQPLVAEGLMTVQGGLDSGAVAFTEKGLSEANEIINRRSPSRARIKILCIDTEPEIAKRMKDVGYTVFDVSMGYRTGKRGFPSPAPNEVDLIVCDLRRPACFDSTDWGPGRSNSSFKCKIIPYEKISNSFQVRGDRLHALHPLIYETQLGKQIPGTFGPKEVNRAIVEGSVPFLLFLNGEWLCRMEMFPNWLDVKWSFLSTSATKVDVVEPIPTVLPEPGREIKFKLAIQNRIEKGPLFSRMPPLFATSVSALVKNNIGDVFGQFVKMGKGQVWLLPATHQNVDVIELFASRLDKVRGLVQPQQELRLVLDETVTKRFLTKTPTTKEETMPATKIKVFISHSSADADIARELIYLLRSAIPSLPPDVIRCTSVSGYRLEGGAKTDEQIVIESLGTDVFIALLSKLSLESTYVLFELGARWGAGKQLVPLVVAGMSESALKPPLNALSAHSASNEDHLFQLVDEVASRLGLSLAKPPTYTAG